MAAARNGRPPDWRRRAVRELREAAPDAAATLGRLAKLGDATAARAVLELLDGLEPRKQPTGER